MGAQMDILRNITDLQQKTEITEMNLQGMKEKDKSVLAKITKFPHQIGFHQNVSQFFFINWKLFTSKGESIMNFKLANYFTTIVSGLYNIYLYMQAGVLNKICTNDK